jgi:hypothetical protein
MDIYLGNLYDKDEDGNYLYQRQILAFELFASTKTGKEFLSQRAQEGFEFKGAFVKGLEFIMVMPKNKIISVGSIKV